MKIAPIFKTTLAEDVPPGPQGQPAHKKGAEVVISSVLDSKNLGRFGMVTPNPVFFYLNYAEQNIKEGQELLKRINLSNKEWRMFGPTDTNPSDKFRDLNKDQLYSYFQKAITVPIFLFTAIEAFANQLIPNHYVYHQRSKLFLWRIQKRVSKLEIERKFSTDKKLTAVLFELKGKQIKTTSLWAQYRKLKNLRDELIHLKTREKQSVVAYNALLQELIDVNFISLFEATKKIMEYYIPDYFS